MLDLSFERRNIFMCSPMKHERERKREREKLMPVSRIEEFKTSIDSKQKRTRAINDDMNKLKSVLMFNSLELVSLIPF